MRSRLTWTKVYSTRPIGRWCGPCCSSIRFKCPALQSFSVNCSSEVSLELLLSESQIDDRFLVLLAKLLGFLLWILTFIDFYGSASVAVRYVMCLFPNTGLLFCIQVLQQYERRGGDMATFRDLYSNIFDYPLYIGLCLLLMLVYSVIYALLAIYIERINPGEFGVSQPWNFFLKKSYWSPSPSSSSSVRPSDVSLHVGKAYGNARGHNHWIDMTPADRKKTPSLSIEHLTKKFGKVEAVSDVSVNFYEGEVCTLLGHNGAGKTTTTFILVGK